MTNQIFVAVADGSQRRWTDAEKELISSSPELIEQLKGWLENSLSDFCWNVENYRFLRGLISPESEAKSSVDVDEEIPF
ncbi:hypothetical protein [Aulosira sp. FACHB-615]|uniref:hypothetical protein n=1 Tax=Aulosira sp. FACHB-615 TaxID=2692777 RepID=UPI001683F94D|nr:hypothetical protein [Aulosira sp. FACHB-615]MBD2492703.1 hypothetical protein [Aulosira sp. FACHB-615]